MSQTVKDLIRRLAFARTMAATSAAAVKERKDAYDKAVAPLALTAKADKEAVEKLEAEVREHAVAAYKLALRENPATAEKKVVPGVLVVEGEEWSITDEEKALAWAVASGSCLIPAALDREALLKVAPHMKLAFTASTTVYGARIDKDLTKAVEALSSEPVVADDSVALPLHSDILTARAEAGIVPGAEDLS